MGVNLHEAREAAQMAATLDGAVKYDLGELQLSHITLNDQQRVILEHDRLYIGHRDYTIVMRPSAAAKCPNNPVTAPS